MTRRPTEPHRRAWRRFRSALVLAMLAGHSVPAFAESQGVWELSLDGSNRRCRLTLSPDPAGDVRGAHFPAGCRRALPILRSVQAWREGDDHVALLDREGRETLAFKPLGQAEPRRFRAEGPDGEAYRLELAGTPQDPAENMPPPPPPKLVPQVTPVDPATAPDSATIPGTYALDRYTDRDVCRLELATAQGGASGVLGVRILEGCRDAGIMAFEPLSWRYDAGRLTILARRGHTVSLISEQPGQWRRDPAVGAVLVLRRLDPESPVSSAGIR